MSSRCQSGTLRARQSARGESPIAGKKDRRGLTLLGKQKKNKKKKKMKRGTRVGKRAEILIDRARELSHLNYDDSAERCPSVQSTCSPTCSTSHYRCFVASRERERERGPRRLRGPMAIVRGDRYRINTREPPILISARFHVPPQLSTERTARFPYDSLFTLPPPPPPPL